MAQNIEELIATGDEEHRWLRSFKEVHEELTALLAAETDPVDLFIDRYRFMRSLIKQLCQIMGGYYQCVGLRGDLLRILRQGFMDRDAETPTARLDWLSQIYALFRELAQGQQRVYWDETGEYLRELGFSLDDTAFRHSDTFKISRKEKLRFMGSRELTGKYNTLLKLVRQEWESVAETMVPLLDKEEYTAAELGALLQRCYADPPLQRDFAENMSFVIEWAWRPIIAHESAERIEAEAHAVLELIMDYTSIYPTGIKPIYVFMERMKECVDDELKKGNPVHVLLDCVLERAAAFFAAKDYSEYGQGAWRWFWKETCISFCNIFYYAVRRFTERTDDLLYYLECAAEAVRIYPSELQTWTLYFGEGAWRVASCRTYESEMSHWRHLYFILPAYATGHPDQRVRASANAEMEMFIDRYDDSLRWHDESRDRKRVATISPSISPPGGYWLKHY